MSSPDTQTIASAVLTAFGDVVSIPSFDGLDMDQAYAVTEEIRKRRVANGEQVVGMKIGFTNRSIWDEYNVHAPMWGYMYDTTVAPLEGDLDLATFIEPRIEPEICFSMERTPSPEMSDEELLACAGWVAHGFEVVQSPFRDWRFTAPDTVAAYGLHGKLLLGPRHPASDLGDFEIRLKGSDGTVEHGGTSLVLGGPVKALRHALEIGCPVEAGHMVTTGTLTRAVPIAPGQTWETETRGTNIAGIAATFA
ncbi:2-keto-4-pentenoate hydratase [Tepidamorphus sp. 3E244]|uniref:2-keto-4-pentenoate hydratase n=1 Tax=Tepidamorphus sp. 3E244 TaxID=3385498 RepID=UPI0038FC2107